MSLKAFHICFVISSIILSFLFTGWCARQYALAGGWENLILGIVGLLSAVGLIFYLKRVLRKLKNISYI